MVKQDKFYKLLVKFEEMEINLFNNFNVDVDSLKIQAEQNNIILPNYVSEKNYILGNVLAETEWIGNVPYDTLHYAIESHIGICSVDSDTQNKLHETLNGFYNYNDDRYVLSKEVLNALKNVCGKQYKDYFNLVADTYHRFMKDIVEELQELYDDIKIENKGVYRI